MKVPYDMAVCNELIHNCVYRSKCDENAWHEILTADRLPVHKKLYMLSELSVPY